MPKPGLALILWLLAALPGQALCRVVIDLATDGTFNAGPAPEEVRRAPTFVATTVNALAVAGGQVPDFRNRADPATALEVYLQRRVIHGLDAFVERAADYADFAHAMTRKLERELRGALLGALEE